MSSDADSRGRRLTESDQKADSAHGDTPEGFDAGKSLSAARDAR